MTAVYKPGEDSYLLLKHAMVHAQGEILDMGTGSGLIAVELAALPAIKHIVATDINSNALENARRRAIAAGVDKKIEFVHSDLFENLEHLSFDWILFNPPYLPSERTINELSWVGGATGKEIVNKFLKMAPKHLRPGGTILLVTSSYTRIDITEIESRFIIEILEELSLFFESLFCWLLKPVNLSGDRCRSRL